MSCNWDDIIRKVFLLNALLNMDCLEASADVTTKIVTIIRYNSNLTEPRFFQLTVNNDGMTIIVFIKQISQQLLE